MAGARARNHTPRAGTATRASTRWAWTAVLLALVLVAAACGDDDDDDVGGTDTTAADGSAATDATAGDGTSETSTEGSTDAGEPATGGEVTALYFSDNPTLDPVHFTGGSASEGHMSFAIYGALVGLDPDDLSVQPILAESLTSSDDFLTWTLVTREGAVFSDGEPYDAEAVKFNWERVADPANASAGAAVMSSVASLEVTDPRTLVITLNEPNAYFANAVSQTGSLQAMASPAAIESGVDFATSPVGAGPWLIDDRIADSSTSFVPNPDWIGSDGPYLDRFTIRFVGDERQRLDTFVTGDADMMFTLIGASVAEAEDDGAEVLSVPTNTGSVIVFNTSAPPFDDVRVRQAVALGVDRTALIDIAQPGDEVANNTAGPDSPWLTPEGELPAYDPDAAQALFDEVTAETGEPLHVTLGAFQTPQNQVVAEFVQTSLNQFDGVEVELLVADATTAITRVLTGDYQAHTLGYPWADPELRLYTALRSGLFTNVARYANDEVDAALDAERATTDFDERYAQMEIVQRHIAQDLPFLPYLQGAYHWIHVPEVQGVDVYEDGILRSDLLYRTDS
jgi:peptide/nickel transport system substrate-binding protein